MYGFPDEGLWADHDDREALGRLQEALVNLPAETGFVCIGTDHVLGDSFGPLVGTGLVAHGVKHVYGTLQYPVHAGNLRLRSREWTQHPCVLAVDSSFGRPAHVGHLHLSLGPLRPGAGVSKELPPVGDLHLTVTVAPHGFTDYWTLERVRLYHVLRYSAVAVALLARASGFDLHPGLLEMVAACAEPTEKRGSRRRRPRLWGRG